MAVSLCALVAVVVVAKPRMSRTTAVTHLLNGEREAGGRRWAIAGSLSRK
jgi:hypothetical protein